ncbi:MAG: hypothetical protein M0R38_05365 [Bacteroidia bacterium]|nr:hypothetical protein [Bacteroidia bacterium]
MGISCTPSKPKKNTQLAIAIDEYQKFLTQFEIELKKSVSNNAETDEWESASQSLFINTHNYHNEIKRHWKLSKDPEKENDLEKWVAAELFSYQLEITILEHWQQCEKKELSESLLELKDADKFSSQTDTDLSSLTLKIEQQITESTILFDAAIKDVKIRQDELKNNHRLLIKD